MPTVDYCALLATAQKAYDDIISGKGIIEFRDQNGESVKYGQGNATLLLARIRELDALCTPKKCRSRPIGFIF